MVYIQLTTESKLMQMDVSFLNKGHSYFSQINKQTTETASVEDIGFGDLLQKTEVIAFCRVCAHLGLGLHLYHEDIS